MARNFDWEDNLYNEYKAKYQDPWTEQECISALQDQDLNRLENRWMEEEQINLMFMSVFGY